MERVFEPLSAQTMAFLCLTFPESCNRIYVPIFCLELLMIKRDLSLDRRKLAWLVGLMEGEGTFVRGSPAKPRRPTTAIGMCDEDVIRRVADLWGTRVWTIQLKNPRHKPVYRTELVGGSAVALMALLRPHLSQRRQVQIDEAIVTYQPLRSIRHKQFHLAPDGADEFDRYWLAGLLEGEGSFGFNPAATPSPRIELNTVDHDVILRVQRILRERYGAAVNIHERPPRHAGYQPQFHIAVYGDAARALGADIEPIMGERRQARLAELLGPCRQRRLIGEPRACYDVRRAA
jgi:hypothetical protein